MSSVTTVLLVEDHRLVREAIAETLSKEADLKIVGEAGDAATALALAASLTPDVIVMDINLPGQSGIDLAPLLRQAVPSARLVALSAYTNKRYVIQALRVGLVGYVTKSAAGFELVLAIRAVKAGHSYISPELAGVVMEALQPEPSLNVAQRLGRREVEVLRLIAQGHRTAAIAESLGISPGTVEAHRRNIMRKLDIHTVADLTRFAIREGLITV